MVQCLRSLPDWSQASLARSPHGTSSAGTHRPSSVAPAATRAPVATALCSLASSNLIGSDFTAPMAFGGTQLAIKMHGRAALLLQCAGVLRHGAPKEADQGCSARGIRVRHARMGTVTESSASKLSWSDVSCCCRRPGPAARHRALRCLAAPPLLPRAWPVQTARRDPGAAAPAVPSAAPALAARAPCRLPPAAAAPRGASAGQRGRASGGCSRRCCCRWRWWTRRPPPPP